MHKIDKRITAYKVITNTVGRDVAVVPEGTTIDPKMPTVSIVPLVKDSVLERPERLQGTTYKIKAPALYDHAIFITLNHFYEDGLALPFELFFNTKNRELTAMLEAVSLTLTTLFRTRTDIKHLLEEYRTIQDSRGGYRGKVKSWEDKPKYYTSILGEIADVIDHYLGVLEELNKEILLATLCTKEEPPEMAVEEYFEESMYPASATLCAKCGTKAVVLMDGCATCLECGDSKCN